MAWGSYAVCCPIGCEKGRAAQFRSGLLVIDAPILARGGLFPVFRCFRPTGLRDGPSSRDLLR